MTLHRFRAYWLTCVFLMTAFAASATTIILPTDEQVIEKSPVIVAGTIVRSSPVLIGDKVWTETILSIDRAFKGSVDGEVTIREIGGTIDDQVTKVFGGPEYTPGERVLVFLTPTPRADFQTRSARDVRPAGRSGTLSLCGTIRICGPARDGKYLNSQREWA